MTTLTHVNPETVHPPGGYSHGVVTGGRLLFVSGQVAFDSERKVIAPDFDRQARQVFENLLNVIRAAGGTSSDVVRLGVILTSRSNLPRFREIRGEFFKAPLPASTLIIAELILPELLLEVEATVQLP